MKKVMLLVALAAAAIGLGALATDSHPSHAAPTISCRVKAAAGETQVVGCIKASSKRMCSAPVAVAVEGAPGAFGQASCGRAVALAHCTVPDGATTCAATESTGFGSATFADCLVTAPDTAPARAICTFATP